MQLNSKFINNRKIFIVIINVMSGPGPGEAVAPGFIFCPGPGGAIRIIPFRSPPLPNILDIFKGGDLYKIPIRAAPAAGFLGR